MLRSFQLLAFIPFFKNITSYVYFLLKFICFCIISVLVGLGKISEPLEVELLEKDTVVELTIFPGPSLERD